MTITVPTELENFVAEQVRAGRFQSIDEAVSAAIVLMQGSFLQDPSDDISEVELEELRSAIDVGLAQLDRGELADYSVDNVIRAGRELSAQRQAAKAK